MAGTGVPALLVVDMIGQLDYPEAGRMAASATRAARVIQGLRGRFH